jgi:hypothetical protein
MFLYNPFVVASKTMIIDCRSQAFLSIQSRFDIHVAKEHSQFFHSVSRPRLGCLDVFQDNAIISLDTASKMSYSCI